MSRKSRQIVAAGCALLLSAGLALADAPAEVAADEAPANRPQPTVRTDRDGLGDRPSPRYVDKLGPIKPADADEPLLNIRLCTKNALLASVLEFLEIENRCD